EVPTAPQAAVPIRIDGIAAGLGRAIPGLELPDAETAARTWPDPRQGRQVEIRVPDVSIGQRSERPAPVGHQATARGDFVPDAVFIPHHHASVVAGPELAGMLLVLDRQDVLRRPRLQRV